MKRTSTKLGGSQLKRKFVHQSGHVKHLEMKLEAIKLECEHLIVYATRVIDKALLQGIIVPKLFHRWVEEAEEIEHQANGMLKSDLKSMSSSVKGELLSSMFNKIVDHLKKSPFQLDLINVGPVNITVKYRFMGKTKIDDHVTKFESKATSGVESGISPAKLKYAEESMKAAQLPENLHGKEADALSTPSFSELFPIIKDETKSKSEIEEIEEMPLRENEERTVDATGWMKSKPTLSAQDKPEPVFGVAQFSGLSTLQAKTTDVTGPEELASSLPVEHEAEHKTECEIIRVPQEESALAAEWTSPSSIKTEAEPKMMPPPTAENLTLEESEIASNASETERTLSVSKAKNLVTISSATEGLPILEIDTEPEITASETEKEPRVKSELNVEPPMSIIASMKGRCDQFFNLQLLIVHGGHSTKMHNVIKDPGFGEELFGEDDYSVFVRTDEKIEKPPKLELDQGKFSVGEGLLSGLLGRPKRTGLSDFMLKLSRLTEPPSESEWQLPSVIALTENEFSSLPEKPSCENLEFLFLQNNRYLRTISDSFFDDMPSLQVLDLSKTGVRSLPPSLFKLTGLHALFLRDCSNLDELPPEVGNLERIEVLDLSGTEVYNLPNEIAKLKHLRSLLVSFYGAYDDSEYLKLPDALISSDIISKLLSLQALSIVVDPVDWRWKKNTKAITEDVSALSELTYLQFYFPEVELLELFIQKSLSWKAGHLGKFKFVIGQDIKRIVSRVPDDVESDYGKHDQCLRFVNGDGLLREVAGVLERVTAFYLDHHCMIKSLSDFGITNFKELKFCVVRECPNIVEIIDSKERADSVLPCLQHLSMHYLRRLENIWKGPVPHGSLDRLKFLSVHTCPKLEFILNWPMLHCLSNMEELIVEDCSSVKVIIEMEGQTINNGVILPRLKRVKLHYLPQLVSLWNDPVPHGSLDNLKSLSVHTCPKLEFKLNWPMLHCVSNMEELIVEDCSSVKVIIEMEGQTINNGAILPRLKRLKLHYLPRLVSLWKGPVPHGSLDNLKSLSVRTCPELEFKLNWPMLHCVSNMEELIVEDCSSVKVIIEMEGQTINNGAILPSLERVKLHYLPRLVSLWNGPVPHGSLDNLKSLSVHACPKLEFKLNWPMLYCVSNMEELIVEDCSSVKVIIEMEGQTINNGAILPRLKRLKLHYLPRLVSLWKGPVPHGSLDNLKSLSVHTCPELEFKLNWPMLHCVSNMEELIVEDCSSVKVIIEMEGQTINNGAILPRLERVKLHYLPQLVSLWNGPVPNGSLDNLKSLSVHTCPKLEFILTWSMLHCLSNMEELIVEGCSSVKVIIEMEGQTINNGAILPRLKRVKLHYLPQLVSLWNGPNRVWTLEPSIYGCPKLKI